MASPDVQDTTDTKGIDISYFGQLKDGREVLLYTLTNRNGLCLKVINYGGIITSLMAPDCKGNFDDIVLGYETIEEYENDPFYLGAIIGRYANRIAKGHFELDGISYPLAINNGENHLHGGLSGFNQKLWQARVSQNNDNDDDSVRISLYAISEDGEEGYPGKLDVKVSYTLTDNNQLIVDYDATTSKPTVINLTQHLYFNLGGRNNGDILSHLLRINSSQMAPVNENAIPTGQINDVEYSPFDFRKPREIGSDINQNNQQLSYARGYDHYWFLTENINDSAAEVIELGSGRRVSLYTDQPGVHFYSGNYLNGAVATSDGLKEKGSGLYAARSGFCLETQHISDAPNQPNFPTTLLTPQQCYNSRTIFSFDTVQSQQKQPIR